MNKGDVVLVAFPFTDVSGSKNRPAIVLVETEIDVTVCFLTTKTQWKEEYDILIEPTSINGLKKTSLVRITKIAAVDKDLILGKLGTLDSVAIKTINYNLIKAFKLDE